MLWLFVFADEKTLKVLEKRILDGESVEAAKQHMELHATANEGRGHRKRVTKSYESDSDEIGTAPELVITLSFYTFHCFLHFKLHTAIAIAVLVELYWPENYKLCHSKASEYFEFFFGVGALHPPYAPATSYPQGRQMSSSVPVVMLRSWNKRSRTSDSYYIWV
jgi:hypothetical protein